MEMDCVFKDITLEEALLILEEDEDINFDGIFIEPPEAVVLTDEDSAEEDESGLVDNLSGRQLRSGAEIFSQNENVDLSVSNLHENNEEEGDDIPENAPPKKKKCEKNSIKKKSRNPCTWVKHDLTAENVLLPNSDYTAFRALNPVEAFELFFNEQIIETIILESTKYALFKNEPDPLLSPEEIEVFIGILIVTGYNTLSGKRYYWENGADVRNNLVYNSMRRDRFIQIMKYLHLADNNFPNLQDKMWKLRPFMNLLQEKFHEQFRPEQHLDFDESMIPYYGKHSCKQFIRGKPIRFGYKAWCVNTVDGYLVSFDIYQGKQMSANTQYEADFGKAASPLVMMIDKLPDNVKCLPLRFYFDNLFTSFNLLSHLKERGYEATGTVRENRLPRDCAIPSSKDLKRKKRGTLEFAKSEEESILVARWVDNAVVTVASTCYGINPIQNVQRYCREEKKKMNVPRPHLIGEYNKYMGGTDRMDENLSLYRIGVRGKKWWWPIFTWLIDATIHNAWLTYKNAGNDMRQLQFRREIAQTYLELYKKPPQTEFDLDESGEGFLYSNVNS
ncbi:piggyBac transposable element-derived protein 3-like [Nilaparvata lugens]|uniref:piggyBac transposable element-derived protein 3-like n=1 Tax=Nilaparvata lugens TaxID=108931 RepID=UPI00193D4C06|nr:piggyBac transposable element-derived protein 3-like [Nilaparvata lugens]